MKQKLLWSDEGHSHSHHCNDVCWSSAAPSRPWDPEGRERREGRGGREDLGSRGSRDPVLREAALTSPAPPPPNRAAAARLLLHLHVERDNAGGHTILLLLFLLPPPLPLLIVQRPRRRGANAMSLGLSRPTCLRRSPGHAALRGAPPHHTCQLPRPEPSRHSSPDNEAPLGTPPPWWWYLLFLFLFILSLSFLRFCFLMLPYASSSRSLGHWNSILPLQAIPFSLLFSESLTLFLLFCFCK